MGYQHNDTNAIWSTAKDQTQTSDLIETSFREAAIS